jgi:hypothetical protein
MVRGAGGGAGLGSEGEVVRSGDDGAGEGQLGYLPGHGCDVSGLRESLGEGNGSYNWRALR